MKHPPALVKLGQVFSPFGPLTSSCHPLLFHLSVSLLLPQTHTHARVRNATHSELNSNADSVGRKTVPETKMVMVSLTFDRETRLRHIQAKVNVRNITHQYEAELVQNIELRKCT